MAKWLTERAISAADARSDFDEILRRAATGSEAVIVEDAGVPSVVILSAPEYRALVREARLARFDRASRAAGLEAERMGLTEEQLEREMEEIKQRQFRERYG